MLRNNEWFFNVQGSVHRMYIPFDIFPTRCNITQFIYFWETALHVSGGISLPFIRSTHNCIYIIWYLLTVTATCRYCGRVGAGRSNSPTIEVDGSNG